MVSLLDARVNDFPRPLFSVENGNLKTFYNVSDMEVISCLAPSTKSHVSNRKSQHTKLIMNTLNISLQYFRYILQQQIEVFWY